MRPAVSGGREKTQREGLRCKVENDAAEGPVVETMRDLLAIQFGTRERSFDGGSVSVSRD